jgi:hypothetical protein
MDQAVLFTGKGVDIVSGAFIGVLKIISGGR